MSLPRTPKNGIFIVVRRSIRGSSVPHDNDTVMKKTSCIIIMSIAFGAALALAAAPSPHVDLCQVNDAIGPVTARYMTKAIRMAVADTAECLIIQLDTPGGLDPSMRTVVKEIMTTDVPVVVYVSPAGSRAASAGAIITLAAHIAAMAPGTNIGAAHPVQLGAGGQIDSTMVEKITHDAAAYIRTIAEKRGRNVTWAERAVRESVSATETEALEKGIIDLICRDIPALLDSLDGRRVVLSTGEKTLHTKDATLKEIPMSLRERLLSTLSNPNIAYVLMLLGVYGLLFELSNPGAILPGVVGGICLILAFFAFQTLSVNYAGLLLILFAVILFIADIKMPTHGILTTGGVIAMVLGSTMLFEPPNALFRVSWAVIVPAVMVTVLFFAFAIGMGLRAQLRRPSTGMPDLIGQLGEARTAIAPKGTVFVAGEHWKAVANEPIPEGAIVRVVGVDRLVLTVEQVT